MRIADIDVSHRQDNLILENVKEIENQGGVTPNEQKVMISNVVAIRRSNEMTFYPEFKREERNQVIV